VASQVVKFNAGEDLGTLDRPTQLLGRLNHFAEEVSKSRSKSGILALIRKLQDGLAAAENLAVHTSHMPSSASLRLSSAAAYGGEDIRYPLHAPLRMLDIAPPPHPVRLFDRCDSHNFWE